MRFPICLALALLTVLSQAAEPPARTAVRLSKPPVIDGVLTEGEWAEASEMRGFTDPQTGRSPADDTHAWIAYDRDAIYVAFRAYDSRPDGIVGREIQRGADFKGEDVVTFRINPFGTHRWDGMSRFSVNVLNTQAESIAGGRTTKREWRGVWTSAVGRLSDGYVVEMRIPWKVLNLPGGKDRAMDINFDRFQARTLVYSMWANTTLNERAELHGRWTAVNPPSGSAGQGWQFLGYGAPESDDGKLSLRFGVDARQKITPQVTGLISVAPDFKNIEQDVEGVGFTRTERFQGDSRPFFTEGSGFFGVGSSPFGFGSMFYSRRIENFDVGGKVFGQVTPSMGIGAMTTVDYQNQLASVVKVTRTFGPRTGADVYVTNFSGVDADDHAVGGGFGHGQGNFELSGHVAAQGRTAKMESAGDSSVSYSVPHVFSIVRYSWVKPSFAPVLGYIPWTDRRGFYSYTEWNQDYRTGPLRGAHVDAFLTRYDHYSGDPLQRGLDLSGSVTTRSDVNLNYGRTETEFDGALDRLHGFGVTFNQSNRYKRFGSFYEFGTRGGVNSRYLGIDGSYRAFRRFDFGGSQSVNEFDGTDRLTILTVGYEMSPVQSITGRLVVRDGTGNAYLAFRRAGEKGTELYVILGDPNAEKFRRRISVKFVWAF